MNYSFKVFTPATPWSFNFVLMPLMCSDTPSAFPGMLLALESYFQRQERFILVYFPSFTEVWFL